MSQIDIIVVYSPICSYVASEYWMLRLCTQVEDSSVYFSQQEEQGPRQMD
jgi:hypothetical protein